MANHTGELGFLLTDLSATRELQVLQAVLFLLIYVATVVGNLLVFVVITLDPCLHIPMYFLLKNLAFSDLCLISTIIPKSILNSLSNQSTISFPGCVMQVLVVIHFAGCEVFILTAMAYDRYVAICHPLRYTVIMNRDVCVRVTTASWVLGAFFGGTYSAGTFSLSFCGSRKVPQFFCDVPSLLKLSCSKDHITINISVAIGMFYGLFCLFIIVFSYVYIFNMIRSIPSVQGRSKAFSTCLPHLVVVTTFLLTGAVAYTKPVPKSPSSWDLLPSLLYAVLPPSLNPVIYTLRNREIKSALRKHLWKLCQHVKL